MGNKNAKVANNQRPPSPNNSNFPVQSNPKFQGPNSYPTQTQTHNNNNPQLYNQNNQQPLNNFNNYNNMNNQNNFPPQQNQQFVSNNNNNFGPPQFQIQEPQYDPNQFYNNNQQGYPQSEPVIHITDNPVSKYDLPRPKVLPLTPLEIMEYKKNGVIFPPHLSFDQNPLDAHPPGHQYVQNFEPQHANMNRGNRPLFSRKNKDVRDMQKVYNVTSTEANNLQQLFNQNSGRDKKIDYSVFVNLFRQTVQSHVGPQSPEQVFQTVDRDNDGLISFDEFLLAYCMSKPPVSNYNALPQNQFYNQQQPHYRSHSQMHDGQMQHQMPMPPQFVQPRTLPLPFGPLDDIDPYSMPLENIAARLRPMILAQHN